MPKPAEVGRKVAGRATVVRTGDLGPTGTRVTGKLNFVDHADATAKVVAAEERLAKARRDATRRGKATAERLSAALRAGGKVKAPDGAEPAGE